MFYFQQLLNQGMAGIDATAMISTMVGIGYAILLIGFLIGLYQAAMRGGDVQALAVSAIKYIVVAVILANWSAIFREVNVSFNEVAQAISSSSGAGDMFAAWMDQLSQQFQNAGFKDLWPLITSTSAALISTVLIVLAYIIYGLMVVIFAFFYTLYGCLLYALGPIVLSLMPIAGVGRLARSYCTNVMIWNSWALIYAVFGSLITAIQMSRVNDIFSSNGFVGFLINGPVDSFMLGLISIVYALALGLIPFIAKHLVSGDVGATVGSFVRAGAQAVGIAISAVAGASAGAGSGAAAGASGGAGAGAGAGAGGTASAAGNGGASSASSSSSSPPPRPSLANTIRSGFSSAFSKDSPEGNGPNGHGTQSPASAQSRGSGSSSTSNNGSSQARSKNGGSASNGRSQTRSNNGGSAGNSARGSNEQKPYLHRPQGPTQTLVYHAARKIAEAAKSNSSSGNEEDTNDEKEKKN